VVELLRLLKGEYTFHGTSCTGNRFVHRVEAGWARVRALYHWAQNAVPGPRGIRVLTGELDSLSPESSACDIDIECCLQFAPVLRKSDRYRYPRLQGQDLAHLMHVSKIIRIRRLNRCVAP
jgi:hypothetical protein